MSKLFTVRKAVSADLEVVRGLVDEFARGHPAEHHERSPAAMRQVYFGERPLAQLFLAERRGAAIGFGGWRQVFDMFWAMHGGEAEGLYVQPPYRGLGVAPAIIAAMCADIRGHGGQFLRATYTDAGAGALYERVAVAGAQRECFVSAAAFEKIADLAGSRPRELLRGLPTRDLNFNRKR